MTKNGVKGIWVGRKPNNTINDANSSSNSKYIFSKFKNNPGGLMGSEQDEQENDSNDSGEYEANVTLLFFS